jgi:hypothetical protein
MKTDEPVVVGNQVVIPKGAYVRASVAEAHIAMIAIDVNHNPQAAT